MLLHSSVPVLLAYAFANVVNGYDFGKAIELSSGLQPRMLRAAARKDDIAKRGRDIPLRNSVILHYIDV